MTKKDKIILIEKYFDELLPNPKGQLEYFNDYSLLISIMLSAQTTDKRVNQVTKILFNKYKDLKSIKDADIDDIKEIIRPLGSYNKKAIYLKDIATIIVDQYNSKVPNSRKELEKLPGIGRKTTNVFLNEFYNVPAIAVDTHVERVSKRLGLAKNSDSVVEVENKLKKIYKKEYWGKRHIQMLLFGRYTCKSLKPKCDNCKLINICKYKKTHHN